MGITKSNLIFFTNLLIFSLIIISSSSSSSSTASSHTHFQTLDVSSSLQQTRQAFCPTKHQLQPLTSSSHSLSLSLHSRSSFPFKHNYNYTSLTLSRLARDEARVHSLLCRHSRRNCKSVGRHDQLESPVISGVAYGSGEYFVRIGVGRPAKEYFMVVDSGSDVTWLQCHPCYYCYTQSDPIYNPSASSTYEPLTCGSRRCTALQYSSCLAGSCIYEVSYGDGSNTTGNFASESISFGLSGSVPEVAIGCGHYNEGLFSGAAGLLGLGGGSLSLPSQIRAKSFSYCLVNRDSSLSSTLDFNSTRPNDSVLAPLLINPLVRTFHYVDLTGISVGGRPVQFPSPLLQLNKDGRGGVIIDSGTTVTRFRTEVYESVRDAFRKMTRSLRFAGGFSLLDTCYDLSSLSKVRVPTVSFEFSGGETLVLPSSNYLIPVDSRGIFCFAFAGTPDWPSIIGNVQQQGMRVSYDLSKKRIGFSLNKC